MDVDFICKMIKAGARIKKINKNLGYFRIHSCSKTQNKENKISVEKELYTVLNSHFNYNFFDKLIFHFFRLRARLTSYLSQKIY